MEEVGHFESCDILEAPMSRDRLPPPPPECLERPYPSSQKGGTLIVEDVVEPAEHARRLCDPDGYRPARCGRCGGDRLHVHDYRERVLRAETAEPVVRIVRHRCASCSAVWRILPLFVARCLWRSWAVVERATEPAPTRSHSAPAVPPRTVRRWMQRLAAAALMAAQVLATSGEAAVCAVAEATGLAGTRAALVAAFVEHLQPAHGRRLADLAALLHRLVPGSRLV
jgi:hypothetical protein